MKKLTLENAKRIIAMDEEIRFTTLLYNDTKDEKLLRVLKKIKEKKQAIYDNSN